MLRRINSTGRRKIDGSMATFRLEPKATPPTFKATLDLAGLSDLPSDAEVVVEAQRLSAVERFDFGTAGAVAHGQPRPLSEVRADDRLQFRVKVVEPGSGRLLAFGEGLRPNGPEGAEGADLLSVEEDDIGSELWRLRFEEDRAVLVLNDRIPEATKRLTLAGPFQSLVLAAAYREILLRLRLEKADIGEDEADDDGRWPSRWLRFTLGLVGGEPPDFDKENEAILDAWTQDACAKFAASHRLVDGLAAGLAAMEGG
jgi:hypothetical protein